MRLFDILGPVMVGPSSSHTAGAVRIGLTARKLLGDQPVHADISLHGSFALTGQVTALRASVAGAEGGCQAEIGTASAMAAAALTHILGGTAQQCADAYAIALGNLLGLVCDPVAGLVEVPCVKRNVIGAVNAVSAANMAVAGITSRIPVDEVIDAMGEVGDALPVSLRETGLGGLAATPTGRQEADRITRAEH